MSTFNPPITGRTFQFMWQDEADSDGNITPLSERLRSPHAPTEIASQSLDSSYREALMRRYQPPGSMSASSIRGLSPSVAWADELDGSGPGHIESLSDAMTATQAYMGRQESLLAQTRMHPGLAAVTPPELTAVRVGLSNQVNVRGWDALGDSSSTYGTETGGSTSSVLSQKHLQPETPRPSEDLEELREDHGLRIEELESQVVTLLERLENLESKLSTAEDRLWELRRDMD